MSLQQSNINKFPKHLQHARLQKEEDEEQWISGEELCTEGSSDEETTNDIKKKFKSKPMHLPLKESFKKKLSLSTMSSTTSLSSEKETEEENTDSTENLQKSPTQWRPKRGSIKLPNIGEKPLDIETEIWNTEFEFQETVKELKTYKNQINAAENIDEQEELCNENILDLENDLEKLNKILEECQMDRIEFQKEVCDKLIHLSKSSIELHHTKKFLDVFKFKSDSNINNSQAKHALKPKFKHKIKQFTKRSSKLTSRSKKMSHIVLNDTEKARLNFLLSDIEIADIDGIEQDKDATEAEEKIEKVDFEVENAFKVSDADLHILQDIDQKLKTLQEMCDDADLKGKLSEDVYSIDEENREWKAYLKLTEDKFHRINAKINKLREQDDPKEREET